ncbi:hypothetical protein FRC09_002833 [Ceratobasidium sp. 395]|nr:hypothetical protein FRC09_002833 [Ceratobasidium sp. 395]
MRREADEKEIIAVGERGVTSREKDLTTEDVDVGDDMQPNMDKKDDSEKLQHAIGASQTVPASHKGTPGSLTLSSEAITFTSLLANISRLAVPLEQIQGVKKTRHTGGLRVHYRDDEQMERELVFRLVSNRDEMFGKLVGWGGKR